MRRQYYKTVTDRAGNTVGLAAFEVRNAAGALVTSVYSGPAGVATVSNPGNADSNGLISFWLPPGSYTITVGSGSSAVSYTWFAGAEISTSAENIAGTATDKITSVAGVVEIFDELVREIVDYDNGEGWVWAGYDSDNLTEGAVNLYMTPAERAVIVSLGSIQTAEQTIAGNVMVKDGAGNALILQRATGIDFQPSDELKAKVGGPLSGAPGDAIYSRLDGERLVYGKLTAQGEVDEYTLFGDFPLLRGKMADVVATEYVLTDGAGAWLTDDNDKVLTTTDETEAHGLLLTMDVISVTGQSLAISRDYANSANAPTITAAHDAYELAGLMDLTNPLDLRGWQSRDYTVAAATGLRVMESAGNNDIPTAALAMATTLNTHRRITGARRASVLSCVHGFSGVPWQQLDDNPATGDGSTTVWDNQEYWYQQAKAVAATLGIKLNVPWHVMVHGTSAKLEVAGVYRAFLENYISDFRAFLAAEGIDGDARFILTQSSGDANTANGDIWAVRQDQLDFAVAGGAVLAGPLYPYPIEDNNVHPDGETTLLFSEVIARAMAEEEAGNRWTPLNVVWSEVSGNSVTLEFDTRPDEVLTLHAASKYGGAGIDAYAGFQAPGVNLTAITVGGNKVRLTADAPITSVKYASQIQDMTGTDDGYVACRGLLRTNYEWASAFAGEPLYRWVPGFTLTL